MTIDNLFNTRCEWLNGKGPASDIVLSTRVRVARNLAGEIFFNWANAKQRESAFRKAFAALRKSNFLKNALFLEMKETSELDRFFFVERHLMSREHAFDVAHKGLVVGDRDIVSVMVNEEDHFRIQVLRSGFDLEEAWRITDEIDTDLDNHVTFAYSSRFGYLTSCPTNTGTGLRASAMLHLAALEITKQIDKVHEAISKLGLTMRGFYGEGSDSTGDFFQISNQVTLGRSEQDILDNIRRVILKIIKREEETRESLLSVKKAELEENVLFSYETLRTSRVITSMEAIKLLSAARLGAALKIIKNIDIQKLNDILLDIQPAHLQKIAGRELDPYERDVRRGDLIREKLGKS